MAQLGTIEEIWRYPVCSIGGERISQAQVSPDAMQNDRIFVIVDAKTREFAHPGRDAQWRKAIDLKSRMLGSEVQVLVPGSEWRGLGDAWLKAELSEFMGFEVEILPQEEVAQRYDVAPLHLITTTSLAHLAALNPESQIEVRRFRPNVVISCPDHKGSFVEFDWIGSRIDLGTLPARVSAPTKRCKLTTIAQQGLSEDAEIIKTIVYKASRSFGVYAIPDSPGRIEVGAPVALGRSIQ